MPAHDSVPDPADLLARTPEADLAFALDDDESPTRITVYSDAADEIHTRWMTIDVAFAVDLESAR